MKSNYPVEPAAYANGSTRRILHGPAFVKINKLIIYINNRLKEFETLYFRRREHWKGLLTIFFTISVLFGNAQASFTLTAPAKTSAGVYKQDGTLIRTLWGNIQKDAGTHQIRWDGTDDNFQTVPVGNYNIKVLTNNVNYQWDGVIGNSSASFTGSGIHKGYLRMYSMCIAGNTAYYSNYYNEGHSSQFKFSLSNPQVRTELSSYGQSSYYSATDGNTVYWAGDDVLGGHNNWFVFGTKVSDDTETGFSSGQSYSVLYGKTYNSVISLTTDQYANITGLAVQKSGNYLFVSRQNFNTIHVLNKVTGAFVRALTIPAVNRLAVDANDNLWVVSANGINKYSVNPDGTLGNVLATINGVSLAWAIAVSPDNSTVTITDGANSQQVKGFSNYNGSLLWTYGQPGGYANSPAVANDKFYFDDQRHNNDGSFIAYQPDGSFWVEDAGNFRAQHYTGARNYIDRIMYLPAFYGVAADPNNPSRVFADLLEFNTDYSVTLAPNNGWGLVNNWGYKITTAYGSKEGLKNVTTLSNGRTYGFMKHGDKFAVLELTSSGIRYTGVEADNYARQIKKDGTLLEWGGGPVGQPFGAGIHLFTGFDALNNPSWATALTDVAITEPMVATDPYAFGSGNVVKTSSGVYVAFDAGMPPGLHTSTDYHLAGFQNNKWSFKTAKSTFKEYTGPFPSEGSYDIGNGVVYAGSMVADLDDAVIWGYHGEFWKAGECNFYNHVNSDGLLIGQFGTGKKDDAPYGLAGNTTSLTIVKDANGNGYLYHNDESVHGGLHRWKITGTNTIAEQVIPIDANFVRTDENPVLPGIDLMAGLPFNSYLPDAAGWTKSNPNVYDGAAPSWWYGITNNFLFDKRKSPDVYIAFKQQPYASRTVTRDLGTNNGLTSWKLSGIINYNKSLPDGPGGVLYLDVLDNNDRVIARLNHEVTFSYSGLQTTNLYGNNRLIHTDRSDSFSVILWENQPIDITAAQGGVTIKYSDFASVTAPIVDPTANWQSPKKMRVYISSGGNYDRRIVLVTMRFIQNPGVVTVSNNANLSNLVLSQGTLAPSFAQTTTSYSASVANNISSITLTPTVADVGATIKVNGTIVASGNVSGSIALAEGSNIITSTVTAQDGITTKSYTVTITRAAAVMPGCESASAQAYTSNTQTGNQAHRGELGMEFIVNNPGGIIVKQLGAFDDGGNGITGLQPGGGVRVAIFNRASHTIVPGLDVTISGLGDTYVGNHRMKNINPVTLMPGDYVIVAKGYHTGEKNGNSGISGGPYPTGDNAAGAITFGNQSSYGPDDPNGFNYPGTEGDFGSAHIFLAGTFNYTKVILCGGLSTNANLSNLQLSQGTLTPAFTQGNTSYTASVVNSVTSITVTPTAADVNATLTVNGTPAASGTPSGSISLSVGSNIITTIVTAQDGTTRSYVVTVTRAASGGICESTPVLAYTSNTQTGNQAHRGELGMEFIVNNPSGIIVKQLGAFDDGGNGITGLQPGGGVRVAIFNRASHTIVPGLDVTISGLGDTYIGNHRMKNITPVTLTPGDYVIVAKGYHTGEKNGNSGISGGPYPTGDNAAGAITFGNQSSYGPDDPNGFNYPGTEGDFGSAHVFLAGTFNYTKVILCGGLSTNANLSNLQLSQGTLTPAFTQGNTSYTASVVNSVTSITVTLTAADVNATLTVNGTPAASGTPSGSISLNVGSNVITTIVTAQDGTTRSYVVTVTRAASGGICETTPVVAYASNTQTGNQAHRGELGMEFIVNNPSGIIVKQLGAFDDGGNGITGLQPGGGVRVAIFNRASHTIVPGLDVTISGLGDAYIGNHRMKNITPVTLTPGDYVIVAKGYHTGEKNGNSFNGGAPNPAGDNGAGAITFGNETSYGNDDPNGFSYPASAVTLADTHVYLAGTFKFTTSISCATAPVPNAVTTATDAVKGEGSKPTVSITKVKELKIYPNPTNGQFNVQLSDVSASKITIQIINAHGKLVQQKTIDLTIKTASLTVSFNLINLQSGIYLVKVLNADGIKTEKLVIQR